jgi:hypothetical protein
LFEMGSEGRRARREYVFSVPITPEKAIKSQDRDQDKETKRRRWEETDRRKGVSASRREDGLRTLGFPGGKRANRGEHRTEVTEATERVEADRRKGESA